MVKVVHVSGKRKRSVAKATLREGKGVIRINSVLLKNYMPEFSRMKIMEPLIIAKELPKKININVKVFGGGFQSQAEAVRLAIARGLVGFSNSKQLEQDFLNYDRHLLIADTRRREQYKPNDSKARAKRAKSYR